MDRQQQRLPILVLLAAFGAQIVSAHVLFHLAFDFHVKTDEEQLNKTIIVNNNQISIKDNLSVEHEAEQTQKDVATAAPLAMTDVWAQQHNLNALSAQKLEATRTAVAGLNEELAPVVGRSDVIAAKVKLITRFLNRMPDDSALQKFQILRKFVKLIDELQMAPDAAAGGERSMEYVLMKLALDKWGLVRLQAEVQEQILNAEEAWQQYVKTKLIEVAV